MGEEEEEEEKRKKEESSQRYGCLTLVWKLNLCMETTLSMDFVWIT